MTGQGAFSLTVRACAAGGTLGATSWEVHETSAAISTATTKVRTAGLHLPKYEGSRIRSGELLRSIASKGAKVFAAERKEHPNSGPITRFHRSEGVSRLPAANP